MVALGVSLSTAAATQAPVPSAAYQAAEQDLMAFSFLGKILLLADNSLKNNETSAYNSTASFKWEKKSHHEDFGDDSDYAQLRSQIAFNLRAKFEGDELEAMKTKIALNLREKFRERDDEEDDDDEDDDDEKEDKKGQDHEQKVGEHDGDRKVEKASHGQNETRKNETHNGKHNQTRKNETSAKHNETKKNETHSKRNETKKEEGHGKKQNETKKHGGDNNLGERNETHPDGARIGENEDEDYFNQHKNGTNQTDKNRRMFLQAVAEPATPAVE